MSESEPICILYMEDDPGGARLVQKRLERAGYIVDLARDGEEGLTMHAAGSYDVVAVDQNMPVHDGLEVIRILASRGSLPPMIMVTGAGNEEILVHQEELPDGAARQLQFAARAARGRVEHVTALVDRHVNGVVDGKGGRISFPHSFGPGFATLYRC